MSIVVGHFLKFWYICAPALAATLFLLVVDIIRFFLYFRKKKDMRAALEAVAQLNGLTSKDAEKLKVVYDLFGDERKGSICLLYEDRFIEIKPGTTAMAALNVHYGRHARIKKVHTVVFYLFASGFITYMATFLGYCAYLQLIS